MYLPFSRVINLLLREHHCGVWILQCRPYVAQTQVALQALGVLRVQLVFPWVLRDTCVVEALCVTPCVILTSSSETKENNEVTESCRQSKGRGD